MGEWVTSPNYPHVGQDHINAASRRRLTSFPDQCIEDELPWGPVDRGRIGQLDDEEVLGQGYGFVS